MFTTGNYINNISLFLIAFTNGLLIITIDNEFRLTAFVLFLGFLVIFPGLSLFLGKELLRERRLILVLLSAFVTAFLILLFTGFNAIGILPAMIAVSYCFFLFKESETNLELIIRILIFLSAPVIALEIVLNSTAVSAALLLIIIIYLQNTGASGFTYFFLAALGGAVLVVSSALIIVYLFFLFYVFRDNLKNLLIFFTVSLISFFFVTYAVSEGMILSYLNYYFGSSLLFTMPYWVLIPCFIILLYISWITASLNEVYYAAGLFIAVPVIILLVINLFASGIEGLHSYSYLDEMQLTIPLFISSIKDNVIDKFRGRVMPVEAAKTGTGIILN